MTESRQWMLKTGRVVVCVLVFGSITLSAPLGVAAAPDPGVPIDVNSTYSGDTLESNHAVHVVVTMAPREQSGAINGTTLEIRSSDRAFLATESITTSETAGGDQVVDQSRDRPAIFSIGQLRPGEMVTISFDVYPQRVKPDGETLATVRVETQFEADQRIVSEELSVAPTIDAGRLAITEPPSVSPLLASVAGAVVVAIISVAGLYYHRRRLQSSIGKPLRQASDSAVNTRTEKAIGRAMTKLGMEKDGRKETVPTRGTGPDDSDEATKEESNPSTSSDIPMEFDD